MKKVKSDVDNILSLDDKKRLLKDLQQEHLLDLFKGRYKPAFVQTRNKRVPLDQQISVSISENEKKMLTKNLMEIRSLGPGISISSYIRNQSLITVDLSDWAEMALKGLKELQSNKYNRDYLLTQKKAYIQYLEKTEDGETEIVYQKKLQEIDDALLELSRRFSKRTYRLTGRVTFNEAVNIRWRAARLSLSVADYMRFTLFGYLPFSDADRHLTLDARKRFYISILDVHANGWGAPPDIEGCGNCSRYMAENEKLKEQVEQLRQKLI